MSSGATGPVLLQLAPRDASSDAMEAGLKAILQPHTGLYLGSIVIGNLAFVFHVFVKDFGIYSSFSSPDWNSWRPIVASLTSAGVQTFYCDRAYKLSGRNKLLGGVIMLLILTSVTGGIGSKITLQSSASSATAGAMAADFIITVSIMWGLSRSKSGFVQTDQIINKLLTISAETQLPPTLLAIAFLIVFAYKSAKAAAHPGQVIIDVTTSLDGFFMMIMPKTYIVGFLAVLNARISLRAVASTNDGSGPQWKQDSYQLRKRTLQDTVKVTTETYVQDERYDIKTRSVGQERYGHNGNAGDLGEEDSIYKGEFPKTPHTSQTGLTTSTDVLIDSRV
uniref:DUF6534 domain-containing protein n=1 Tax=Kwoniella bestiolae CBS 10118 TaxID=1296100 RepID=A0A1B9GD02_9TREE|nr:hypothetical protein I302_00381 [Kwoniella bestiolae CBS 10118]OCF28891.1 hypothetical protein I302_00381 [Kwoniella bestiolae CBS 10118]